MATKGYSSQSNVELYLGRTLTTDQEAQADTLLAMAEAYIDRETRRQWIVPAITDERYDLKEPRILLRQAPVSSVTSVKTRTAQVGDTPLTLTAGTDYELIDATRGEIQLSFGFRGRNALALVSYVPNRPVPADITFAATLIVAHTLTMTLFPDRMGITEAHVDGSVQVKYEPNGLAMHIPQRAMDIIMHSRLPLIV